MCISSEASLQPNIAAAKAKKSLIFFSGAQAEGDDGKENYDSFVFDRTASKKAKRIPL